MLTLTRRVGEKICLEGGIEILVKEIHRGHVRLGVEAPREVRIWREELPVLSRVCSCCHGVGFWRSMKEGRVYCGACWGEAPDGA